MAILIQKGVSPSKAVLLERSSWAPDPQGIGSDLAGPACGGGVTLSPTTPLEMMVSVGWLDIRILPDFITVVGVGLVQRA
jgi:hypothetical protein